VNAPPSAVDFFSTTCPSRRKCASEKASNDSRLLETRRANVPDAGSNKRLNELSEDDKIDLGFLDRLRLIMRYPRERKVNTTIPDPVATTATEPASKSTAPVDAGFLSEANVTSPVETAPSSPPGHNQPFSLDALDKAIRVDPLGRGTPRRPGQTSPEEQVLQLLEYEPDVPSAQPRHLDPREI
jgi:hypothetical protein